MQQSYFFYRTAICIAVLLLSSIYVSAQNSTGNESRTSPETTQTPQVVQKNEGVFKRPHWGFYGGSFTFHRDLRGQSARARFGLFAIRYATVLRESKSRKLRYNIDFAPVAIMNYVRERQFQTTPTTVTTVRDRKTVYGLGFSPAGFQLNFRNDKKYQPFIAGGVGYFFYTKPIPDNRSPLRPDRRGSQLQFTADFGAGVEIPLKDKKSFFVGYKYHHQSNFYTVPGNVGFNTNLVYAGMYFNK